MGIPDTPTTLGRILCDFTGGPVGHRFRSGGGRRQALPRAIGMKGNVNPCVVDATAGLGRDAFLLASLGASVILIERSEEVYHQLAAGMARARTVGQEFARIMDRMRLLFGDARELLPSLTPEIILVDPMHPPRTKSAQVKNEMRIIREIVGTDDDSVALMEIALATARKRVVLKWPRRADPMAGIIAPSHQIIGKSVRYDVFLRSRQ